MRISYTLLSLWKQKSFNNVVRYIEGDQLIFAENVDEAITQGSAYDQLAKEHIDKTKTMPPEFGGFRLRSPITFDYKDKWEMELPTGDTLVGVPDVLDVPTIFDLKTGKTSANTFASTLQLPIYYILAKHKGYHIERMIIAHYNQYTQETEWSIRIPSVEMEQEAMSEILAYSQEIKDFYASHLASLC